MNSPASPLLLHRLSRRRQIKPASEVLEHHERLVQAHKRRSQLFDGVVQLADRAFIGVCQPRLDVVVPANATHHVLLTTSGRFAALFLSDSL